MLNDFHARISMIYLLIQITYRFELHTQVGFIYPSKVIDINLNLILNARFRRQPWYPNATFKSSLVLSPKVWDVRLWIYIVTPPVD
jgi:hypothetical protein